MSGDDDDRDLVRRAAALSERTLQREWGNEDVNEPRWNDITGLIRVAKDGETIELTSDSKITQDVTEDLKRGVRVKTNGYKLVIEADVDPFDVLGNGPGAVTVRPPKKTPG